MNTTLWIIQGVLAAVFFMAGTMKAMLPKEKVREKVGGWVDGFSASTIKMIGLLEVLGAIGLVVPLLFDFYPVLTPAAAGGLVLTMISAAAVHSKRGEKKETAVNIVLLLLGLGVVVGRVWLLPVV